VKPILLTILVVAALALCAGMLVIAFDATRPDVSSLARRAPRRTAFMLDREAEAKTKGRRYHVDQRWVSYERISPLLRRAVLIAEDDAFYAHGGLDWNEIRASARKNWEKHKIVRGGSTITQQLAKNIYLGGERTVSRKVAEVVLAWRMEGALSKRRIFELYLNLIEWGDGIYGAEAAAQRWFGVSASQLDAGQAARLAAVVINPRKYSPTSTSSRRVNSRARMILGRLLRRGFISQADYAIAVGGPPPKQGPADWIFGPLMPEPEPTPPPEIVAPAPSDSMEMPSEPDTTTVS
jgi:monofunctional biosynthetic peptidoglycan transglycosylase